MPANILVNPGALKRWLPQPLGIDMNCNSPCEVLEAIEAIYPAFRHEWETGNPFLQADGSYSLHSAYMTFLPFFAAAVHSSSQRQLRRVAALINDSVSAGGSAENAVATCFLEHAGQVGVRKILSPFLSKEARERFHA